MSKAAADIRAYTVRLELVDRPGELLRALRPIADNGGNLLSIFHERGNVTPRGHIPVEAAREASSAQFDAIVAALKDAGMNVIQAGQDRYNEELVVVLVGDLVSADLSAILSRIQSESDLSLLNFSLAGPNGGNASARLRLALESETVDTALASLRQLADEKELQLVEPLGGGA